MSFKTSLDSLANKICEKAVEEGTSLTEKIDAFKALTTYRAMQLKERKGASEDDDEGFDTFAAQLEESRNGRAAPVSSRHRST